MRPRREFLENLLAELVARFVIGGAVAGLVAFWLLPDIARLWEDAGWCLFLAPAAIGVIFSVFGIRKGPGVI